MLSLMPVVVAAAEAQKAAVAAWGFSEGQPITLGQFAVQLDQRFLSELSQTGANFSELFGSAGRAQLVKVSICLVLPVIRAAALIVITVSLVRFAPLHLFWCLC